MIAGYGDAANVGDDKAPERLVLGGLLVRQRLRGSQKRLELARRQRRLDQPGAVLAALRLGLLPFAEFGEVADDSLADVDQGHEPLHGTELIGHDRNVLSGFLE